MIHFSKINLIILYLIYYSYEIKKVEPAGLNYDLILHPYYLFCIQARDYSINIEFFEKIMNFYIFFLKMVSDYNLLDANFDFVFYSFNHITIFLSFKYLYFWEASLVLLTHHLMFQLILLSHSNLHSLFNTLEFVSLLHLWLEWWCFIFYL